MVDEILLGQESMYENMVSLLFSTANVGPIEDRQVSHLWISHHVWENAVLSCHIRKMSSRYSKGRVRVERNTVSGCNRKALLQSNFPYREVQSVTVRHSVQPNPQPPSLFSFQCLLCVFALDIHYRLIKVVPDRASWLEGKRQIKKGGNTKVLCGVYSYSVRNFQLWSDGFPFNFKYLNCAFHQIPTFVKVTR